MPKRIRRVRTFARTATKTQEKYLIENAKHLHDNPEELLPDITDESGRKYITQLHKRIEKAHKYRDETQKLEKIANKKGIEAAVAGTLLLAISEKAPYLGVVKLPTGDVTYAQRGKADKEKLIGIQHYTDPILRLMMVKELSFKKNLYFYSWDTGYICTGKTPQPPQDFISFISKELNLIIHEKVVHCKHLNPQKIREESIQKEYYLRIFWKSADWYFGVCEDCAKHTKNSMYTISKYMLAPALSDDFDISVIAEVIKHYETDTSETTAITEYFSGKITDYEIIQKNIRSRKKTVADAEERILILNGKSYGDNIEGFIEALDATSYEIEALTFILSQ
ncbi:MAG: hypothetical protein KKG04_10520, partial [Candidatus Thermoplasmatota archaeon]|nr:hypothetical protein [Candidatus Thermoplasmatota archaeon]MBU1863715.1 hypothetical protein [Candidatus Omnitrophota bacterium]